MKVQFINIKYLTTYYSGLMGIKIIVFERHKNKCVIIDK